jgi:uncharacterized protein (TIGR03067 family)
VKKSQLPARPNLDHLRRQAKILLGELHAGSPAAADTFIAHLHDARGMSRNAVRAAGFRLADAQSVIARKTGFAGWPALSRHVQQLRALEGDWRFTTMEIDGRPVPASGLTTSRLLIDGDRFRSEMADAVYEGIFTIDVEAAPAQIDIEFVEGPEAGNICAGIYELDDDRLTMCLGLVGASRPLRFATRPGSGHALERLHRASAARPVGVSGGTAQPPDTLISERGDPAAFDVEMTPLMRRLEGEWVPVQLVQDGRPLEERWLPFGSRTMTGNEVKVVFGGQVQVHAKVRLDERAQPIAVDYLNLSGKAGTISRGIMEWVGDEVRFLMARPGQPRPRSFEPLPKAGTLSQWRRRA